MSERIPTLEQLAHDASVLDDYLDGHLSLIGFLFQALAMNIPEESRQQLTVALRARLETLDETQSQPVLHVLALLESPAPKLRLIQGGKSPDA